jgi:hypothetical protein
MKRNYVIQRENERLDVNCLPSMCEGLGFIFSTHTKKIPKNKSGNERALFCFASPKT